MFDLSSKRPREDDVLLGERSIREKKVRSAFRPQAMLLTSTVIPRNAVP